MNNKLLFGILGLVLGIAGTLLVTKTDDIKSNTLGTGMISSGNSNTIDSHFIEQMIPHHEDAISMSKLAQTKATRQEVKKLAETIIDSQGREVDQMKAWYKDWYGIEVPQDGRVMQGHGMKQSTKMHMGMMGDESDTTRLEQAGDFDKAFVEEMIPHHQMAVMMATMLRNGTQRNEMRQLADNIISSQTSEIDQMRSWLKEWGN